jgi:hypothetical protein
MLLAIAAAHYLFHHISHHYTSVFSLRFSLPSIPATYFYSTIDSTIKENATLEAELALIKKGPGISQAERP